MNCWENVVDLAFFFFFGEKIKMLGGTMAPSSPHLAPPPHESIMHWCIKYAANWIGIFFFFLGVIIKKFIVMKNA